VQQEFLQTAYDSGRRLKRLVDDLLDVSRMESGRFSLNVDDVDLNVLIRQALDAIKPLAEKSSVAIATNLPDVIPMIKGDPARLGQVLDNFLSNAVKFSVPGGRVTLSVAEETAYLCLNITDAGIGIPAEDLPHLFTRFHRARNVGQDAAGGAGLGLYIANAIVGGHGGRIDVESVINQGTTFYVRLPYSPPAPAEESENPAHSENLTQRRKDARKKRREEGAEEAKLSPGERLSS
jgi:signal transduction histidine kinase